MRALTLLLASTSVLAIRTNSWIEYMDSRARDLQLGIRAPAPPLEVTPLIVSGDPKNRIDLVFFSDGYLASEKSKFLNDASTFAKDITTNATFQSVQPLMNFWAAFTASKQSGVGKGGKALDTVYQLYRDGTELRGVYSNKSDVGSAACASLGSQCDYPVLLGNDPLYGGLGGVPTIITASPVNGPSILRHELGHSIIKIGEEYDGQPVSGYFGINAAKTNATPVSWAHWLTDPQPRQQRSVMPIQQYAWALLNMTTPWAANFVSSGTFSRHLVRISISGVPKASDLKVEVDEVDLGWVPRDGIGMDRYFYDVYRDGGLKGGTHEVKFTLRNASLVGSAQMCSVEVLEFGNATEFVDKPGYVGLYPTYSSENKTTYRPTNEDCLMRQVTTSTYCPVCLEGLWTTLLSRVSLIDNITESSCSSSSVTLTTNLVPLAQFRKPKPIAGETYSIQWLKNGVAVKEFANKTSVVVAKPGGNGNYTVDVKLSTPEIRLDRNGVTEDKVVHVVSAACT
ncbi:hypothetical protein PQX77_009224 [Marasmius sp. AFHP31]|nr:hypothetical protein PQX77_009224 [Marasmius sp. AFHP31]